MTTRVQSVLLGELLALVDERRDQVRAFVDWAECREVGGRSMYLTNRSDISDARKAAEMYPEGWWGVVVFTCFGCLNSTRAVRDILATPVDSKAAEKLLASLHFTHPTVGHHRIQQALLGAKKALVAACQRSNFLYEVLHAAGSFDDRYQCLHQARLASWGCTTCFDLLLRTGALSIGGKRYEPEVAYLAGSTGPKAGFRAVWGRDVTTATAAWCEGVLQAWHRHWAVVVDRFRTRWSGVSYGPGDLENALCIYQERLDDTAPCSGDRRPC